MERWQKRTTFLQNISDWLIVPFAPIFFKNWKKGRHTFEEEEENEILQRNIEENSNNIAQNQEQQLVVLRQ